MQTGGQGTDQVIAQQPDAGVTPAPRKSHPKRWLFILLGVVVLWFGGCTAFVGLNSTTRNLAIAFAHGATKIYDVSSASMAPTMPNGTRVASTSHIGTLKRGDVVIFREPSGPAAGTTVVKRVIGLPGERIEFRGGDVLIDGREIAEPYLYAQHSTEGEALTIPADQYYVMGDNRANSLDSRHLGAIPRKSITHVVIRIVYPSSVAGSVPGSSR